MKRFSKGANKYWQHDDGGFSISDDGGWIDGSYENEQAADLGHEYKHLDNCSFLKTLQHKANLRGDSLIRVSDFEVINEG